MLNNFNCGNFVFNASFDSGNLHKVELVKSPSEYFESKIQNVIQPQNVSSSTSCASSAAENVQSLGSGTKESRRVDVEFNLWTKPDCHGTQYENGNRTWFFFSIRGGEKCQNVKLNVMNLNKQAKLFSQGMHPVIRHGLHGKWERIKDRPTFYVTEENFVLSLIHRTFENVEENLTFYAFTFPYTYTEQLEALALYDSKYEKSQDELDIIVRELNGSRKDRLVINMSQDLTADEEGLDENAKEAFDLTEDANDEVPSMNYNNQMRANNNSVDENTSESMQQLSNLVNNVQIEKNSDLFMAWIEQDVRSKIDEFKDEIYYYRELLINSYENRRIDLLTITSFLGVEETREERQPNLFPDTLKPRAHTFRDKKIIFISSRVHPGETPASFVLNGFLNHLLDRKSQIAATLRKNYVFKIVPFLNPDGVYNGLYRSDTLGHNLNRVYLNPRLDTQPSIYAVRKLIRNYHYGYDKPDIVDENGQPINDDELTQMQDDESTLVEDTCDVVDFLDHENRNFAVDSSNKIVEKEKSTKTDEGTDEIVEIKDILPQIEPSKTPEKIPSPKHLNIFDQSNILKLFSASNWRETFFNRVFRKKFLVYSIANEDEETFKFIKEGHDYDFQQFSHMTLKYPTRDFLLPAIDAHHNEIDENENNKNHEIELETSEVDVNNEDLKVLIQPKKVQSMPLNNDKKAKISSNSCKVKDSPSTSTTKISKKNPNKNNGSKSNHTNSRHHHHYKHFISHLNNDKQQKAANQQYFNSSQHHQGFNISMDYRIKTDENGEQSVMEENSNLFLYLDLHGHASKKGVFMYGNHLPNTLEAVEVMLLPKLMSLNCHHFAFDACNFSERNMYLKGKRDGLSKEGSGRVAVYKSTGLIKSYTLESNYNTSKVVNILPPKGKDLSCKVHSMIPPKFTPAIFEEVGRALGPSLLDLTNSNPNSRIPNSEYRSLQGLRNALRNEINRGLSKARVSKFAKQSSSKKRQTSMSQPATSSAQETSKENKVTSSPHSSSSNGSQSKSSQSGKHLQGNKMSLKPILGKVQAFAKKDVNVLNSSNKKKKVLCEASSSMSSVAGGSVVNQIPRKKIKVSNGSNNGNGNSSSQASAAEYFLSSSKTLDDEMMPCCSKSIPAFLTKAPTSPASSSSSTSSNGGQVKITSFMPIKKHAKTKKLKGGSGQFQPKSSRIGGNKLKKLKVDDSPCANGAPLSLESITTQTSLSQSSLSPSSKLLKKKKLKPLKSLKKRSQKPLLH